MRFRIALLPLAAALVAAASSCSGDTDSQGTTTAAAGCATTIPNGAVPPGEAPASGQHGNGQLWTVLDPSGTIDGAAVGDVLADGSVRIKFPWWRATRGRLRVSGEGKGVAGAVRAHIPAGYGESGFQASALIFPAPGCWTVLARAGSGRLSFTVRIVV